VQPQFRIKSTSEIAIGLVARRERKVETRGYGQSEFGKGSAFRLTLNPTPPD